MSKITLLAAGAAGYVLGARAGRQRYEQIASTARSVMRNPKVKEARHEAAEKAKEAASSFAHTAVDKVRSSNGNHVGTPSGP